MLSWATRTLDEGGYGGLTFMMFAENVFPPIPSEIIMPLAGYSAASGRMELAAAILFGSIGSLAGAYLWYFAGRSLGGDRVRRIAARHSRWVGMGLEDVDRATRWFRRRGFLAVLLGRCIPGVRSAISIPAGVTRMPFISFTLASVIGIFLWTSALTISGYLLAERYQEAGNWIGPVGAVLMGAILAAYLYRVATYRIDPVADVEDVHELLPRNDADRQDGDGLEP